MRRLNNRGFILVEVIAIVVIISVLAIIFIPNINGLLVKGRDDAIDGLKKSILVATKEYVNDNRYEINFGDGTCVSINTLIVEGYLSPSGTESNKPYIINPSDNKQKLNLDVTCVYVIFNNNSKIYEFDDFDLAWQE